MKFIDEKGNLWGKINIIDFLAILFFICIIPMLFFIHNIIVKRQEPTQIFIETEINCKLIKVKPEFLSLIKVGDKELDKDGTALAEIVWLGDVKPHEYEFNVGGVGRIMKIDKELKDVFAKVKLRAEAEQENSMLFYKGRQFLLNFPIEFNMRNYFVQAVPILVSRKESLKERWVEVRLRLTGISPDLVNIIHEKDVELDSEKRTVGILQKIISNKPSEVLTIKENNFITLNHPYQRDIDMVIDILGTEKEGVLYFKNYPVKIGNTLMFTTEVYNVNGAIVGLEIK